MSKHSLRLFIGFYLPPEGLERLRQFDLDAKMKLPLNSRKMPELNMHLTILFLGEQNMADLANITNCLEQITKKLDVFRQTFNEIRADQDVNPRLVWWRTDSHSQGPLQHARKAISNNLRDVGISFPKRREGGDGHITLIRIKESGKNISLPIQSCFFRCVVSKIHLVSSKLTNTGAIYDNIQSFTLVNR